MELSFEPMGKGRVEAFSDGVFAIAGTLLILNVHVDKTHPGGLVDALLAAWPSYAAYVASFLTIGVMWMNHHSLFIRIVRLDRPLVFLNLLLLMVIVFLPFPTALLGQNILVPEDARAAATFYALDCLAIAIFFSAVWTYAIMHEEILSPDLDRQLAIRLWPRFTLGPLVYLVCIALAQVSPIAVVIVCAAIAVYYTFERLPDLTRKTAGAPPTRV